MSNYDKLKQREQSRKFYDYAIGIDTGTHTGIAVYDIAQRKLIHVDTVKLHVALLYVLDFIKKCESEGSHFFLRVEDARQRNWFGSRSQYKLQGAGSVKHDSVIWQDFLLDYGLTFEMVAPQRQQGYTKLTQSAFTNLTGYKGRTSEHARDAAMLVFGCNRVIPF